MGAIENEAYRHGKQTNEISTADLGDLVLEYLHKLDRVAYIRFASVYRHFEDIDEFTAVIKELRRGSKK
ncbi:MAG: hypothetical protein Ta2A_26540 [Treponemataceae bacterium]|nr:MAG: hypothetical protein Ta2A_26540 [Treponemataceae bacterium]